MEREPLWIGLMSGTSADAIDAVMVRFNAVPEIVASHSGQYPRSLRQRLIALSQQTERITLDEFAELDQAVGECFAAAAMPLIEQAKASGQTIAAIGSHGQTLRHRPSGTHPFTLQIGDPNVIAERSGCRVIADFRRRDVAAGGQGAPLLPALHAALFACSNEPRAVLNLGGIANLTLLPADGPVRGFDSGPANALLDAWCLRHRGVELDRDGAMAAAGTVQPALLAAWLDDPWFALPPPKSSGRDQFQLDWLAQRSPGLDDYLPEDVQASLVGLTAESVMQSLRDTLPDCRRLIVCGGGVHNPVLMQALTERWPGLPIESSAQHGLDPDWVEAVGFAWLAQRTVAGQAGNLPSVSGARGPRVLGAIYAATPDGTATR